MDAIHEIVGLDREIFGPIVLDNEMGKVLNLSQLWNLVGLGFIGHLLEGRTICPNHLGMYVWRRGKSFSSLSSMFLFSYFEFIISTTFSTLAIWCGK